MAGTGANSIPLGTLHPIFSQNKSSGESSMLSLAREAAARVTANIKREHGGGGAPKAAAKGPGSLGKVILFVLCSDTSSSRLSN